MKKMLLLILIMTVVSIVLGTNYSKAALQSNGGSPATKNVNDWITQIRKMQATGGTLGLTDSINGTNLTSGNKNLDIHMEKNTEYGAMVILSASAYGNPNKVTDGQTTTGNQTGVLMKINKEWVATGMTDTEATNLKNASNRYKNQYTALNQAQANYIEKAGDAIATVGEWHGSTAKTWLSSFNIKGGLNRSCLIRSYSGSIFSYYGYGFAANNYNDMEQYWGEAHHKKLYTSRAVVVVGSGI